MRRPLQTAVGGSDRVIDLPLPNAYKSKIRPLAKLKDQMFDHTDGWHQLPPSSLSELWASLSKVTHPMLPVAVTHGSLSWEDQ